MNLEEYNEAVAKLKAEGASLAKAGKLEDAEAKKAEIETLTAQFEKDKAAQAEQNALTNRVVPTIVRDEHKLGEENIMPEVKLDKNSKEYHNAFLKHLSGRDEQMTKLENAAFVQTTENTTAVLPTTMLNQIWDLVSQSHVIVGDITVYKTGTILEIVKHTAIAAGKAAKVAENAANDDEQNTFVKVTLSGHDFAKTVKLSYAAAAMSLDALESYITTEIANSLGEAIADDFITSIESGIDAGNKITTATVGSIKYADILKAFGLLKRATAPVVYCTRNTLYNQLAALTDGSNRLIYQPSATVGVPGTLLGSPVKIEDSVADGVILVGDPKRATANMIQDIMIETDKDIEAHKYIYSGYARGEAVLVDGASFAQITVKTA